MSKGPAQRWVFSIIWALLAEKIIVGRHNSCLDYVSTIGLNVKKSSMSELFFFLFLISLAFALVSPENQHFSDLY